MRVLSYNIHKGFSGGIKKYTLAQMREEIRKRQPDVIFLQEVHGRNEKHRERIKEWPEKSQFEYLAEGLWPHFSYGKNVVYSHGDHGNAILSKYPITGWDNVDISQNRFERRGVLHAILRLPASTTGARAGAHPLLHAFCVHLGLFEADRQKQLTEVVKLITERVPPREALIAAGDFNDWRKRANLPLIKELGLKEAFETVTGSHAKTFPSWLPAMRLDRVYYRGLKAEAALVLKSAPWNRLSDHTPLEVVFKRERH